VHPRAQSAPFHGALDNLSQITALMASLLMLKAVTVIVVRTRGGSGTNQIAYWVIHRITIYPSSSRCLVHRSC